MYRGKPIIDFSELKIEIEKSDVKDVLPWLYCHPDTDD